jgi:hypothetical protein
MYISRSRALNPATIPQPANPSRKPVAAQALSARAGEQPPCAPAQVPNAAAQISAPSKQQPSPARRPGPCSPTPLPLLQDSGTDGGGPARLCPCSWTTNRRTNGVVSWPSSGALRMALLQVPAWSRGPWSSSVDDTTLAQLMCALSWTYTWRSQHCLELKNLTSFIGENIQG